MKKIGELEFSSTSRVLDTEDSRRAGFVDMLLDMDVHNTLPYQIRGAPEGSTSIDSPNDKETNSVYEKKEATLLNRAGILLNRSLLKFLSRKIFLNNISTPSNHECVWLSFSSFQDLPSMLLAACLSLMCSVFSNDTCLLSLNFLVPIWLHLLHRICSSGTFQLEPYYILDCLSCLVFS